MEFQVGHIFSLTFVRRDAISQIYSSLPILMLCSHADGHQGLACARCCAGGPAVNMAHSGLHLAVETEDNRDRTLGFSDSILVLGS